MMDFLFRWLREGTKNAILDGAADAGEILTSAGQPVPPRLAALAAKLTPAPALPPAEADGGESPKPRKRPT